jgi:hypothetical protein
MAVSSPGLEPEINLVAIHTDQQQILIDQNSATIRLPRIALPHPFAIRSQDVATRFADIISDLFGLKGSVIALSSESRGGVDGRLFVAFYVQEVAASSELDRKGLRWRELVVLQELLDPSVSAQLQNAINLVRAHRIADDLKDAWSVKRGRLLQLLRERMAEKDGLIGWTQFLVGDSVGVLSTAQGILTFLESGEAYESLRQNIQTLRTLQNDDGGWPVRRALIGHSERSITESTIYCLWALGGAGTDLQDSAVVRGIEWLERAQLKDGGWGSIISAPRARTYPTAFATRYLARTTGSSNMVKQALSWLRESQNADGGWGPLRGGEPARSRGSTPLHTAHALSGLLAAGAERGDQQVVSGVNYLRSSFRASDSEPWPSTSEVESVDTDAALDFRHFTTPWAICALLECGASVSDPVVSGSVQWLLSEQHSLGYWSSDLAPGQSPIWASFDAVHALKEVREAALVRISDLLEADARVSQLDLAWRSYFTALDTIQREASRHGPARNRWLYVWNGALTFFVALILVYEVKPVSSNLSTVAKFASSALLGLVPAFGPFVYDVILDQINKRESKR